MIERIYRHPRVVCALVFVMIHLLCEYVLRLEVERERESTRSEVMARASTVRARIEGELNSTVYLGIGLTGYLSLEPDLDDATVARLLSTVYQQGHNIRNIGLAPNNKIAYVYPLEGNVAAIGLEFKDFPDQQRGVQRAIEVRSPVVMGPVKLVQGGYGIITYTPVFLYDGRYWGIISMVVDVPSLLDTVENSQASHGMDWAIRTDSDVLGDAPYVYGDAQLFERDAIRQSIELPGGLWEIAILPEGGLDKTISRMLYTRRVLNFFAAGVMALLVYLVLRERVKVHHMAVHDTLTGLPNRRLLFERLEQRIAMAERYDTQFCIVYVDLDRFKPINDTYGHRCGDLVLCEVAERMRGAVRGSDTVARVGGDEFVILLPDTTEREGALAVGKNLLRAIEQPIKTDRGVVSVGASLGIGLYPENGTDPEELLAYADNAMYREKAQNTANADGASDSGRA